LTIFGRFRPILSNVCHSGPFSVIFSHFGQFRPISTNLGDFGPFQAISAIPGQTPQTPSRPYPASTRTAPTNSTLLGGGGGGKCGGGGKIPD
jgi:hypothetical protein